MTISQSESETRPSSPDQALETIAQVISGLVGMMEHGQMPAVDFADLKTMFERNRDGTARIWYVGQGTVSGENRACVAAQRAAADWGDQYRSD